MMTKDQVQSIISEAAGRQIFVSSVTLPEDKQEVEVETADGDVWIIFPGPCHHLRVKSPDGFETLVECK